MSRLVASGCVLWLFLGAALSPPARAQDLGDPPPITPDLALLAAQQAYTAGPVAERIQIRLNGARSWITLRLDAGKAADLSAATLALELGDLRVHVADGVLTAASTRAPDVYFQSKPVELSYASLEPVLPPVPLPQIVLARGFRNGQTLTPYTTDVRWTAAAWDDVAGTVRLTGQAAQGAVTLELDRHSGRLRRLAAETDAGQLELIAEPIDAEPVATWTIDTTGRQQVARLSALTEQARSLVIGDAVPDLAMLNAESRLRPLSSLIRLGPEEWVEAPDRRLILILAPLGSSPRENAADPEAFVRAMLAAVGELVEEADAGEGELCPFAAYLVVFARTGGFEGEAVEAAAAAWEAPAERIVWTPMEMPRLDGIEPGHPATLVIDAQRRILAILGEAAAEGEAVDILSRLRPSLQCGESE